MSQKPAYPHEDPALFKRLVEKAAMDIELPPSIVEKDYYVCLALQELSERQRVSPAYFKGGTALYKSIMTARRFSEDIDLTVPVDGLQSNNQKRKRLEKATLSLGFLPLDKEDPEYSNRKGSITAIYKYKPVTKPQKDPLARFGRVKLEGTSFGVSEPREDVYVESMIASVMPKEIADQVSLPNTTMPTMTLERIFADKVFAAEAYWIKGKYFEASKHMYDLVVMSGLPRIERLMEMEDIATEAFNYRRKEESARTDSELCDLVLEDAAFFSAGREACWQDAYRTMQDTYIFRSHYKIDADKLIQGLEAVRNICKNDTWSNERKKSSAGPDVAYRETRNEIMNKGLNPPRRSI